mmetsp:Transcript_52241/g.93707  ORF Transcript_52241/g.93707 Transcript_52241/m.93707 type:complete len:219 (-) Transcript_52241:28-684(-)
MAMAPVMIDEIASPKIRLKAHEDWIIGNSLVLIREGFEQGEFQDLVESFAANHAADFMAIWPDGSHPLLWTSHHQEYKSLFEAQIERTLAAEGMTQESFQESMRHLQDVRDDLGDDAENINGFLTNLTAADDYSVFLQVMIKEVRRQQEAGNIALPEANPQMEEIQVVVPEGYASGQVLPVEHCGNRYEIPILDGYSPGMTFQVPVMVPTAGYGQSPA